MSHMFEISFLAPVLATIVAIINFLLVFINFRSKPWSFKFWLILAMFFWIPWAGATILMRIASTEAIALIYLQISFVSSYVCFYSLFRFHNMLSVKRGSKFLTYFMAVFMGINLGLGLNFKFLNIQRTADGLYYTDQFEPILFFSHVLFSLVLGYLVFRVIREINTVSIFYSDKKGGSNAQVLFGLFVVIVDLAFLGFFYINEGTQDATPFIILSILATTWLGINYGVRPLSNILTTQRLWTFFIIAKSGIPIYEFHFSDKEQLGELALIGGAINASNVTMMSYLDSKHPLEEIELEDRVVIIENYKDTLFCLVSDENTQLLQLVHKDVVQQIFNDPAFTVDETGFATITDFDAVEQHVKNTFVSTQQEVFQ